MCAYWGHVGGTSSSIWDQSNVGYGSWGIHSLASLNEEECQCDLCNRSSYANGIPLDLKCRFYDLKSAHVHITKGYNGAYMCAYSSVRWCVKE